KRRCFVARHQRPPLSRWPALPLTRAGYQLNLIDPEIRPIFVSRVRQVLARMRLSVYLSWPHIRIQDWPFVGAHMDKRQPLDEVVRSLGTTSAKIRACSR